MKFALALFAFALSSAAYADTAPALKINYLQCGGYDSDSNVGTALVYNGTFAGHSYLNLSTGGMTVPSMQQVKIVSAVQTTDGVMFQLHAMVTGDDMQLAVLLNTKQGYLTQDGVTTTLQCNVSIAPAAGAAPATPVVPAAGPALL